MPISIPAKPDAVGQLWTQSVRLGVKDDLALGSGRGPARLI
jgi:hypothetical protein